MKKQLAIFTFFAVALVFTGCKYEEGPSLSLRSKKARLAGEYTVQKATRDGEEIDISFFQGFTYIFDKDGNLEVKGTNLTSKSTYEFGDKKETLIITDADGDTETYTILKLTNDEFWYTRKDGDMTFEFHLKE
jgi:hypothetical protein